MYIIVYYALNISSFHFPYLLDIMAYGFGLLFK